MYGVAPCSELIFEGRSGDRRGNLAPELAACRWEIPSSCWPTELAGRAGMTTRQKLWFVDGLHGQVQYFRRFVRS